MGMPDDRVRVWDLPLRLFHWVLVATIALAFLSSEEDSALNEWHVLSGWVAAILIVFRIAWGFIGGEHSRFVDFIRPSRISAHLAALSRCEREASLGHNPLGAVARWFRQRPNTQRQIPTKISVVPPIKEELTLSPRAMPEMSSPKTGVASSVTEIVLAGRYRPISTTAQ